MSALTAQFALVSYFAERLPRKHGMMMRCFVFKKMAKKKRKANLLRMSDDLFRVLD